MDRTERFYRIDQLLRARGVVPRRDLLDELGVSPATFKRDLEYMRDRLNAPIVWDRDAGGYRLDASGAQGPSYELPGLWFNAAEAHALLTMQHLLAELQPGLLAPHLKPLQARVRALLEGSDRTLDEVERRIRIFHLGARVVQPAHFATVAHGLLERRRLCVRHYSRERDSDSERELSPQRLVHYRDNWYLDAWCHVRKGLRTFALENLREVRLLPLRAREVADRTLDRELGAGYGIFSGRRTATARLRFSPRRARWVAGEQWHPEQRGHYDAQGHYVLEIPYSDDRELIMDILRHGAEVEVIGPPELRRRVASVVKDMQGVYR